MLPSRLPCGLALAFILAGAVFAQTSPRPLTHADFDTWRSINTPQLSRDGQWLAYSFMPQDADGDLVVREVATGREHRIPVGAYPPPPAAPTDESAPPEAPPAPRNIRIAFTTDAKFVIASTHPSKSEIAAARAAKKKPEEMPRSGLVMVRLADGEVTRVAEVKSFQVPAKGGAWIAYLKEPKLEDRRAATAASGEEKTENDQAAGRGGRGGAAGAATGGATTSYGTELVLRDLAQGTERTFASVSDYSMTRDGAVLLYTVSSRTQAENGVYAATPGEDVPPRALLAGRGRYSRLAWDREQTQAVFVSDRDTAGGSRTNARYKLYHWPRGAAEAIALVTGETKGIPSDFVISSSAAPAFSRDGRRVYVALGAPPRAPRSANAAPADENKVTADLWHWRDGFVQPMQKTRAGQERSRTYRGVFDLQGKTYTQLGSVDLASVTLSDDGMRAIGYDDRAYRHLVDYDGRFSDVYVVNAETGERKLAVKQMRGEGSTLLWSPDGRWAGYYQDKQWRVVDATTGDTRSLTESFKVALHNEQDDRPAPPSPYGSAGWTKDSASLLVYDRYDVWQVFVDGRAAKNLTAGHGRAQKLQLRVQRIDPVDEDDDERGIDPAKALVLRGESEETRATGFFKTTFTATQAPQRLLWGDKSYRYVGRARDADALLITASRFNEYPEVHVTDSSFAAPKKLTDGGAQMTAFAWGTSELVSFKNADGVALKAALYKPANFDPKKKYPLIVYIYERLSQNVHNFVNPAPGQNVNPTFYTSNGFCVLMPDIVYKVGAPGQSALRCVLPAIDAVVPRGFVDEKAIGIQGHSWGGYQIAYMLTQTNRFRAAEAGAPVGNMTSAYSGIRWGSGLPRQFQYETGQSRIGASLHAKTQAFLDNSPIFHVQSVSTPLLILHNDQDDAVPFLQGIELFLALRRHGKHAWLMNYNGEPHGIRRRANQKDFAKRMHQFFDHYLKGAPAPKWLEEGIPYIERDEEKERFNAPPKKAEPVAAATQE